MTRWLLLIVVLLSGCSRWTGLAAARDEATRVGLQSLHFSRGARVTLESANLPPACGDAPDGFEQCVASFGKGASVTLTDDLEGSHVALAEGTEPQLSSLWRAMDPHSLARWQREAEDGEVAAQLEAAAAAFEPRWGLTAGVGVVATPFAFRTPVAVRVGVRRWLHINAAVLLAAQYEFHVVANIHAVHVRLGAELARFTGRNLLSVVGVAPASIGVFIGPAAGISGTRAFELRTGVAINLADIKFLPLSLEIFAATTFGPVPLVTPSLGALFLL